MITEKRKSPVTLTTKRIDANIIAHHTTMTATQMSVKFGHDHSTYTKRAKKLGLSLVNGRGKHKSAKPKAVAPVAFRTITPDKPQPKPKPNVERNPRRMAIRTVDYSSMILVPLGVRNMSFYVDKDASVEEIVAQKVERLRRLEGVAA